MTPGLRFGIPADAYHADEAIGSTMLAMMAKSPAHYFGAYLSPSRVERRETDALAAGHLLHTMTLEPETMATRYIVKPDGLSFATKAGKAWRAAAPKGASIVTEAAVSFATQQAAALLRVQVIREIMTGSEREVSVFWGDRATGMKCKARPDAIHRDRKIALDIKSIRDLTLDSVPRAMARYGYHRQQAHYLNGLDACGERGYTFAFAFVSSEPPIVAGAFILDDLSAAQGRGEVAELLGRIAECTKSGTWPSWDGFQLTALPAWAMDDEEVEISYDT